MIDLRCDGTMHARLDLDRGTLEVKCGRRRCGAAPDVVVLHTFNLNTGEMVDTRRFANPPRKEDRTDDAS
jgi:hypothetical protein